MQYLGGKSKFGHVIVRECERWRKPGKPFVDVFMGGLNVVRHAKAPRYAFDVNQALVTTFARVIDGTWDPPRSVSKDQHSAIKKNPDPNDPLTAFVMFGCSFSGMWGSAYARNAKGTNYAEKARRSILEKAAACRDLKVACSDYRKIPDFGPESVLYCDPPYENTAGYDGAPPFDHDEFWATVASWSLSNKLVFVSEGDHGHVRRGWVVYREWWTPQNMQGKNKGCQRVERLLVHESSPMAQDKTAFFRLTRRT